mmetsp:Transcript_63455/g.178599  ORF Transcript_63455/g.178599 Transcript_63455/m.178599 type:complete len:193 (-) Transcript_63455:172-750(-)
MVLMSEPFLVALAGPPSSYALSMRPWLLLACALLLPVAAARFLVADAVGGLFLVVVAGIGWYAVRGGVDIGWLLCLAVVLFLNSAFDAYILIQHVLRVQVPLFGSRVSKSENVIHGLLMFGPVIEMVAAFLCWRICQDQLSRLAVDDQLAQLPPGGDGQAPSRGGAGGEAARRARAIPNFEAFQGAHYRLCD